MKTIKVYLTVFCLLVATGIHAQHYITGSLQGGWSSTFDNMEQTKDHKGLLGAQIGVGYEWQYQMLLVDVGLEFSYYKHRWDITDQHISQLMRDTEGWPFIYNGTVTDRTDDFSCTSLRIPVLGGMQVGKFYFLAGVIPDIHFSGTSYATGTLNTEGDYSEFYATLIDMANHGFYEIPQSSEDALKYKVDLLGHIELGVTFGEKHKYRLAAFGEIGMLDIAPRTDIGRLTDPDFSKYMNVYLHNPYVSNEGAFANLHKYEAGLKFSVAVQLAPNRKKEKKQEEKPEDDPSVLDSIDNAIQDSLDKIMFAEMAAMKAAADQPEPQDETVEDENPEYTVTITTDDEELDYSQLDDPSTYKPFGPNTQLTEQQLNKGEQYTLQNIYFDTDMSIVQVRSLPTLKQLYRHLVQYPNLRIRIIGHTDSVALDWYNMRLSRRRAESVKRTLMRWGIDASRLETDGRGEREPVATNETEEGRQLNRRVVFEVL